MKTHAEDSLKAFFHGCDRAESLRQIYLYMQKSAPIALNCDDILRSAVMLVVSSFDLFIHDIFRGEVLYRVGSNKPIKNFKIPFNTLITQTNALSLIDEAVRKENSFKSFVSPDKLADCLKIIIDNPWEEISYAHGVPAAHCKAHLKSVIDLRNRIAHEADVNPAYGGIELWPIYSEDVGSSIKFLRQLGTSIAKTVGSAELAG